MYKIEALPHTADARLRIEADTLEELFRAALRAMGNLLQERACDGEPAFDRACRVALTAGDATGLLIDLLSEVLTQSHAQRAVFCRFKSLALDATAVRAEVLGRTVDGFDEDIKAVTYHEAGILRNETGNWQTNVVFDI